MSDLNRLKKADLIAIIEDRSQFGSVEGAVRRALPPAAELRPFDAARAEVAINLACQLDAMASIKAAPGSSPPAPAPVAKELGVILSVLEVELAGDDGDDESAGFFRRMSSSMGD